MDHLTLANSDLDRIETTISALCLKLSDKMLSKLVHDLLGNEIASILASLKTDRFTSDQAARTLVALCGQNILANRDIRLAMVREAHYDDVDAAFKTLLPSLNTIKSLDKFSKDERIKIVGAHAWHPGSAWSRSFCDFFALPKHLAGETNRAEILELAVVSPFIALSPLHNFQENIRIKLLKLLEKNLRTRALVALPTGAGKTRLLVQALLDLPEVERGEEKVVWVAQHNELCEQAVQCFSQVWASTIRPRNRRLAIQRVWKGHSDEIDWSADVFVGTPQSLEPRLSRSNVGDLSSIAVSVVDEAHYALGPSYAAIFSLLSVGAIFGITATPGSSQSDGARVLRNRFMDNVLVADELGAEPVKRLQELGFLAVPEVVTIPTQIAVEPSDANESSTVFEDFSRTSLNKLGHNVKRNSQIIDYLLSLNGDVSVLCFAPSVRSARAIAAGLAMGGRTARSVDAESEVRYRNETVEDFKAKRVQFLINYGVLATGFDAPKIDYLVLARPTLSPVLYEQMLGRGLRGPRNGGTAKCKILHFEDDFSAFGGIEPMSYGRFISEGNG